jgi:hypothetical protein
LAKIDANAFEIDINVAGYKRGHDRANAPQGARRGSLLLLCLRRSADLQVQVVDKAGLKIGRWRSP